MTVYEKILHTRQDMTNWLLHFTRKSEHGNAKEVLRSILVEGVIRPGFAPRGKKGLLRLTVYGPTPAVCFSEQPLNAFVQYLSARNDREAMAGYGILIHKQDVYVAGGLPVVYGLREAEELSRTEQGYDPERRLLRPEHLPFDLQYRYMVFVPTGNKPIDWTHEREWRWPANAYHGEPEGLFYLGPNRYANNNGVFEGRIHAVVDTNADILWLQRQLTDAFKRGEVGQVPSPHLVRKPYSDFWREHLGDVRIISLEEIRKNLTCSEFWRFDDWPDEYKYPLILNKM